MKLTRGSEGHEESKGVLDSYSLQGGRNLRNKHNSKRAYHLVKEITSEEQGISTTIQIKSGNCLTKEQYILSK